MVRPAKSSSERRWARCPHRILLLLWCAQCVTYNRHSNGMPDNPPRPTGLRQQFWNALTAGEEEGG